MNDHAIGGRMVALYLATVAVGFSPLYAVESTLSKADTLGRIPDTRYDLHGVAQEYIGAITANWLLKMPDSNPAILEMFANRDKQPHRDLLPWSGEFAGKYLTGAVQIHRLTHDPALKKYLAQFVTKLVQVQADDGYLGPFPQDNRLEGKGGTWDAWGHYHIMLGLLLWHEDTGDKQALQCAVKIGDLLCRKFLGTGKRIVDTGEADKNHAAVDSLCLLYEATKTPAYLELARQIADQEFQDNRAGDYLRVALAGKEYYQGPKPRWESLHSIQGLAELYRITGDEKYRKAFEAIWWSIVKLDRHNNGGFSSGEQAQGNPYHPGAIETCCTVAWIAMSVDMLRLSGNSIVADELELSTLNQVLGYQHRSGTWCTYNTPMEGVRIPSTTDIAFQIRPGSEQINCCSANAPRGFGMISDWALMTDGRGLVVNWYGPSTISAKLNGTTVAIEQQTEYPRDGRIVLTVSPEKALRFGLKLRIPHWSANSRVQVNGQAVAEVKAGAYLVLDREWKSGDRVQVDLDMSFHYWVGERESAGKTSIYRGPLLLVYEEEQNSESGSRYDPEWKSFGNILASKDIGAVFKTAFDGTSVTWKGFLFDDAGKARVTIDGKEIAVVDQYGPKRGEPFAWTGRDLQLGKHSLELTILEEKNPDSKDHWVNVESLGQPVSSGPVFDAANLAGRILPTEGAMSAMVMMEMITADGKKVRLRDYGTAGEGGIRHTSWLNVQNAPSTPFSPAHPLRSGRVEGKKP